MNSHQLVALLKELQGSGEKEWIEFKLNNGDPDEIGEYISALSNAARYHDKPYGYLVFGIEDKTKRLVGSSYKPKTEKRGNQELENWLATLLEPRVDFEILEFEYEGKDFAILRIARAFNIPIKFKGQAYIRIGTYKKKLSEHPERERKIWADMGAREFEREIALEKISPNHIVRYLDWFSYFEMIGIPLPNNNESLISKFVEEKFLVPNVNGTFDITNLGALLFAFDINHFDSVSRKSMRVITYKGNSRISTLRDQVGRKGYANGFAGLIDYIMGKLPSSEIIEAALRKEVTSYPVLAIRELVANALIHQDFSIRGTSPMVEIFDNRVEITNPGNPLIDPLRFMDHSPESRNEILAKFMRRLKICEERGSGIDKVVYECESHKLPAPDFIVGDNFTKVVLYPPTSLRHLDKGEKIKSCYLHACLKYVSGEVMTNQSIRIRFDIEEKNYPMASRIINDTKEAGLIKDYDPNNKSKQQARYLPFWA